MLRALTDGGNVVQVEWSDIGAADTSRTNPRGAHAQQRRTERFNTVRHLLLGASLVLLPPVLRQIPMAVLLGLFVYLGVSLLAGNGLWERLKLGLMEPSLYPSTSYVRKVPIATIHKYTLIQFACLMALWAVTSSPLGVLFPLLVVLLVPFRSRLLSRLISPRDLALIDAAPVVDSPTPVAEPGRLVG